MVYKALSGISAPQIPPHGFFTHMPKHDVFLPSRHGVLRHLLHRRHVLLIACQYKTIAYIHTYVHNSPAI